MHVMNANSNNTCMCFNNFMMSINRGYLFFSVKDQNLFHRVDTIGNIFTSGAATSENITDGVTR